MNELTIYGARAIIEAIESDKTIDKVLIERDKNNPLIKEVISLCRLHQIPIQFVPKEKFLSYKNKNHQGIIAKLSLIEYQSLENIIASTFQKGELPLILILDGITDVRNFGAIARTALSAGVHAIVIEQKGQASINDDAVKTSAGALMHIPVCREKSLSQTLNFLKLSGLQVIACTEKTNQSIYSLQLTNPLAVIMGNEEKGISPTLLKKADYLASIPMYGEVASLNVSVATGIILYECIRQRNFDKNNLHTYDQL